MNIFGKVIAFTKEGLVVVCDLYGQVVWLTPYMYSDARLRVLDRDTIIFDPHILLDTGYGLK